MLLAIFVLLLLIVLFLIIIVFLLKVITTRLVIAISTHLITVVVIVIVIVIAVAVLFKELDNFDLNSILGIAVVTTIITVVAAHYLLIVNDVLGSIIVVEYNIWFGRMNWIETSSSIAVVVVYSIDDTDVRMCAVLLIVFLMHLCHTHHVVYCLI